MSSLTHSQKLAFSREILETIEENKEELAAVKFDVEGRKASLATKVQAAEAKEAEQIKIQAKARAVTEEAKKALAESYNEASSDVDAIVGLLLKSHSLSKRLRQIRDSYAKEALRGKKAQ